MINKFHQESRQELDINLKIVIGMTILFTMIIYLGLLPFKTSYLGILLYERGFTQPLAIIFANFVIATIINKFIKLKLELRDLQQNWIPESINFDDYQNPELNQLCQELARDESIIAIRCSRIISAYINSGSRKAATELGLDDSSFYLSFSESSYTFPKILIWAIPLLGFIGTVFGISTAVNGFSAFLENSTEIDQIKEGIGIVTTGLAVAFDTTLLALLLSVAVMIPLVLVEKMESRLLLQIDVFINDQLLPKLQEKPGEKLEFLDTEKITKTINNAIQDNLPTPEELINPAEKYAKKAAQNIAETFIQQFSEIQTRENELIQAIKQVNLIALEDRQEFLNSFLDQQKLNKLIIREIQDVVAEIKHNNDNVSTGLESQTNEIRQQLNQAALSLENKVISLESSSSKIAKLSEMANTIEKIALALEKTDQMEQTLAGIRDNILILEPTLKDLGKPRIIKLVEQIDQNNY